MLVGAGGPWCCSHSWWWTCFSVRLWLRGPWLFEVFLSFAWSRVGLLFWMHQLLKSLSIGCSACSSTCQLYLDSSERWFVWHICFRVQPQLFSGSACWCCSSSWIEVCFQWSYACFQDPKTSSGWILKPLLNVSGQYLLSSWKHSLLQLSYSLLFIASQTEYFYLRNSCAHGDCSTGSCCSFGRQSCTRRSCERSI